VRALITGIGGFAGRHLARNLVAHGYEVGGIARRPSAGLDELPVKVWQADLRDADSLVPLVSSYAPDTVFHLAAQASAHESLANPWPTIDNNCQAQLNLLRVLCTRLSTRLPRVLVVSTSDVYGNAPPEQIPTSENVPTRPPTAYATSKVLQEALAFQHCAQFGLPVVIVRAFSHTGPGQDTRFAIPSFARQIAEIELGRQAPVLRVGNLNVLRDISDVRDMVEAYRLAIEQGTPGEVYNLGSGRSVPLARVVEDLVSLAQVPISIEVDRSRLRAFDAPRQEADISRFAALTGWSARTPLEVTLRDTLAYWRERARTPAADAPERP
jgi:GDP-4-dehydro-6-deoxy-D-mannose reductase